MNGKLLDPRRPGISVFDRGFLYGDGVYETLRIYGGRIAHFDQHARRLKNSARGIGIGLPYPSAILRSAARRLLKANGLKEAVLRITVSRGPGPLGFDPAFAGPPTCVMMALPAVPHPGWCYSKGIRLLISRVRRTPRISLDPAYKSTNNLNNILAKREAVRGKAYEALMLNTDGFLAEGTISNVFFIRKGVLKTPALDCGILEGVTRASILRAGAEAGLKTEEGFYRPRDLERAEEVFITSTTMEAMPVRVLIDEERREHPISGGRPGPWSAFLRKKYQEMAKD